MKILDLKSILEFVRTVPLIPKRGTKEFRSYKNLYESLIESVPNTAGIYLWVGPDCKRIHRYVGISVRGFRNRFNYEFWQEYTVQWETEHEEKPTIPLACQHYPKWIYKITSQSYRGKAGTKFIAYHELNNWSELELRELEAEFIQHFDPVANEQRPLPNGFLHKSAMEVARLFENTIREREKV